MRAVLWSLHRTWDIWDKIDRESLASSKPFIWFCCLSLSVSFLSIRSIELCLFMLLIAGMGDIPLDDGESIVLLIDLTIISPLSLLPRPSSIVSIVLQACIKCDRGVDKMHTNIQICVVNWLLQPSHVGLPSRRAIDSIWLIKWNTIRSMTVNGTERTWSLENVHQQSGHFHTLLACLCKSLFGSWSFWARHKGERERNDNWSMRVGDLQELPWSELRAGTTHTKTMTVKRTQRM